VWLLPLVLLPLTAVWIAPASAPGQPWMWPVVGPVITAYEPPETPFGAGHRGIDIAVRVGTTVVAPDAGVVTFSGKVGGHLFLTIDHGGGVSSTCSWLSSVLVRRGDLVARGQPVAASGIGHPGSAVPHVHFGVRRDGSYVDPFDLLGPVSVSGMIRLAPIASDAA